MNKLEYSYCELPSAFYSKVKPLEFKGASTFLFNVTLAKKLNISEDFIPSLLDSPAEALTEIISPFAQGYAGHQFGHFTMLGDGRAMVLGEVVTNTHRFDLQLKGSGPTAYNLSIYNRWGELLFESLSHEEGWPGYYGGLKVPAGTYTYTITYFDKKENRLIQFSGHINVIH